MKKIPILMRGEMVCAILGEPPAAEPKTVTRRSRGLDEINQNPGAWKLESWLIQEEIFYATFSLLAPSKGSVSIPCPYGMAGDRLWVRENVWRDIRDPGVAIYDATPEYGVYQNQPNLPVRSSGPHSTIREWKPTREESRAAMLPKFWKLKPSIHMPRWASRLTLVRSKNRPPERLQAISEDDARREGAETAPGHGVYPSARAARVQSYREGFRLLYQRIHGAKEWDRNPWVWPIEFARILNHIDKE